MSGRLIFGLDIGSSKVVSLVGALGEQLSINGLSSYYFANSMRQNDFSMISNGLICDIEKVGIKISQCLHETQISADCSPGSVIVNLAGHHLRNVYSQSRQEMGSYAVNEDIIRLMVNEARQIQLPPNFEIIDYEIQEYLVDNDHYTINPLELSCASIDANVNIFIAGKTPLSNMRKAISYSQYDIAKIVPSSVLAGMAVLNREEKELGVCLIDIGAGTSDIIVYENGFIRYLTSIPLGGEDITRDIASVLKLSRNLAEDLKLTYGSCQNQPGRSQSDSISLVDHRGVTVSISRKLLQEIIVERVKDIFGLIKMQLKSNDLYDIINSGIVLTGGVALIPRVQELSAKYFDLPTRIGIPNYHGDFADIVANPRYATAVGALYFANEMLLDKRYESEPDSGVEFSSIIKKIKSIFKNK